MDGWMDRWMEEGVCEWVEKSVMSHTNVDDVSSAVQHQVTIVSIFDLQQETDDGVRRHAFDEIGTGLRTMRTMNE